MKLNIGSLRLLSGIRKIFVLILIIFILCLVLLKISGPDSNHVEFLQVSRTNIVHIALTGQLTERHPNIFDRLSNITKSIYKHCEGGQLLFHVFTDLNSTIPRSYTDLILKLNSKFTNIKGFVRMYDLETIFSRYENVLQRLIYNYWDRSSIKNPSWALPFRSPIIFLRPIYYLLDELKDVDKIISPDSDMIFMADIYQLYLEFSKMNESQMIGMGPEFVYCDQVFKIYNSKYPNNEVVKKNHVVHIHTFAAEFHDNACTQPWESKP
ncbi:uncharacterized protein LOC136025179 isoform X2 [Artemia franciscana]|uniref:uncharacterized protein LOC136025179 isoform X2 n=1 Tax=Artemia franciscana TaxID=6661 RepID=UPI0032DA64DC